MRSSSRAAGSALGTTMACSRSRRPLPRAATSSRTRAASGSESGLCLRQLGHEGQHRHVRVAVEEHLLDEVVRIEAAQGVGLAAPRPAGSGRASSSRSGRPRRHAPSGSTMWVWMSKMNWRPPRVWAAATGSKRRLARQLERPAPVAPPREGLVQREERRRGPARAREELATAPAGAAGVLGDPRSAASLFARSTAPPTGSGANSPLDVESSLIGSVGSCRMALSPGFTPVYSRRDAPPNLGEARLPGWRGEGGPCSCPVEMSP